MASDPSDIVRELGNWYRFSVASSVFTVAVAVFWRPLKYARGRRLLRDAFDGTWFLPVYVWGMESINRLMSVLDGRDSPHGGVEHFMSAAVASSALAGAVVLGACVCAETMAAYRGLPARSVGSVPLPVFAGVVAVAISWSGTIAALALP